jgi:hypothetical protein
MGRIIALNQYFTIGLSKYIYIYIYIYILLLEQEVSKRGRKKKIKKKIKKKRKKKEEEEERKKEGIFNSEMQMDRIIALNQYFTIGTRSFKERKLKRKKKKKWKLHKGFLNYHLF